MGKILRYAILFFLLLVIFSVVRGVNSPFKRFEVGAKVESGNLPGLESPSEFVRAVSKRAIEAVSGVALGVTNSISQKVADAISDKATEEISKNFQNLNEKEKEILKKAICPSK